MTDNITGPGFELIKRASTDVAAPATSSLKLTDLAKTGLNPMTTFTGGDDGYRGPVLAEITTHATAVWIGVDPAATVPMVRAYCEDPDSPYAEAARNAVIVQSDQHLTVTIPEVHAPSHNQHGGASYGGSHFNFSGGIFDGNVVGNVQNVYSNGNRTVVSGISGGRRIVNNGVMINGNLGVEVEILLPADSGVRAVVHNGPISTRGHLAAADLDVKTGPVNVDSAGRLKVRQTNGPFTAGTITEWIDRDGINGPITVNNYQGSQARVHTAAGPVTFIIGAQAKGAVNVTTDAGPMTVHGARAARARGVAVDARTYAGPFQES